MANSETMSVKAVLLKTLQELSNEEFKLFKWHLMNLGDLHKSQLQSTDMPDTVDMIIQMYHQQPAEVVKKLLESVSRNDLVEELSSTRTGTKEKDQPSSPSAEPPLSPTSAKAKDALKTNVSLKYKDIISESDLLHSGSPTIYQLRPKKENNGTLKRMTLGEKDLKKTSRTILLVGETGSGKSTLINALVNFAMGVEWEDDIWFQIVEDETRVQPESQTSREEENREQPQSQTSDVLVYQIFGFEDKTLPYSLTIIDTPGYGDTRGIEQDVIISQRLFDWFRLDDGVHEINTVGLVLKASENRLSDRLKYVIDSVVSLFGKNLEKNIVALITHSDGLTPKNTLKALEAANIQCAKDKRNQPVHFLFNNCQSTMKTRRNECVLKCAWDVTTEEMGYFTDFLEKASPQRLMTTIKVLKARIRLTACVQNLKERIELTEQKQREIQQTQETLKTHEQQLKTNQRFTVDVDEVYKEKKAISAGRWWWIFRTGAVCCTVCEENCHCPCTLAWYVKDCDVMKNGRCTACSGKCPVSAHVKEDWIYETKTRKVKKTLQDVKNKYEKSKKDSERTSSLLKDLEKTMEELEREKDHMLVKSFEFIVRLEQIALNVDSLSTHVHLDFLIERMKEKGDTERVRKLEEIKSRLDENKGFRAALRYMFG